MIADKKQPSPNCLMENDAPAAHETLSHTARLRPISYPSSTLHAFASIGRISTQMQVLLALMLASHASAASAVMPMDGNDALEFHGSNDDPDDDATVLGSSHTAATSTRDPWSCSARTFARTI